MRLSFFFNKEMVGVASNLTVSYTYIASRLEILYESE